MIYKPYKYQDFALKHILTHKKSGLFIDMGLGKTVVTLSAIAHTLLMEDIDKVLIITPLAVAKDTWEDEIQKWKHLRHLSISKVLGTEKERKAALEVDADIYTINCENVPWLVSTLGKRQWRFNYLVVDESSKFKDQSSKRFKAVRMSLPKYKRVTILTGTPRPNSLMDLWSQLYLLDQGERLEPTITAYRQKYFNGIPKHNYVKYDVKVRDSEARAADQYERKVYKKIGDICISMKAKDYVQLPERIERTIKISLPNDVMAKYRKFEEELVHEIEDKEITAANAAVLTGKLLQFSNGAIYDNERNWHKLHDEKLKALEDIVDVNEGKPILVLYNFRHDYERICKKFKHLKPVNLKTTEDRKRWNEGKIKLAVAHPKSMGHGLNLQAGGNIIVWFGLPWSLELYEQANARLHRLGQLKPVIIHHLVCKGTADIKALWSLKRKASGQDSCMEFIKARIDYYKTAA